MQRSTHYLTMRDGVRLAVNCWLPQSTADRLPTIIHQTRYMRSIDWKWPLANRGIERYLDSAGSTRERFVAAGYAWIDVDVRGSGASGGSRPGPWWRDEVADSAEVVEWVIRQPWSSGRVGTTGISYSGTCSEMMLINRHPAVRACAPRFSLFDVYADVAFPGGIQLEWFTRSWSQFNTDLDRNAYHKAIARMLAVNAKGFATLLRERGHRKRARLLDLAQRSSFQSIVSGLAGLVTAGVTPVDGHEGELLRALADHLGNFDVHGGAAKMVHRDDRVSPDHPDETIDVFSPHTYAGQTRDSGVAILSVSGWLDGGYNDSAAKRFANGSPGRNWLLLGPWGHGGRQDISAHTPDGPTRFDHDGELIRFFDAFVRDRDAFAEPAVRYFTMGAEAWRSSSKWPPASVAMQTLHLAEAKRLAKVDSARTGHDECVVDNAIGTGHRSRWKSLLGMATPLGYGDRARGDGRGALSFTGAPLERATEVTGHPVAQLSLTTDEQDGSIFVYLEDVDASGTATYVTEGQLRLLHRAENESSIVSPSGVNRTFLAEAAEPLAAGEVHVIRIPMLAVSYQFAPGNRVRLTVTGADGDHFAPVFANESRFAVHYGAAASTLELPVDAAR